MTIGSQSEAEANKWLAEIKEFIPPPKLTSKHREMIHDMTYEISRFKQDKRSRRKRAFKTLIERDEEF